MNKYLWAVLGVWLGLCGWCWADEASHRQAVEELFDQIGMEATVDQTVQQVAAALTGAVPEDMGYHDAVAAYVNKYIGWEALKDEVVALYLKAFTEPEVNKIKAFYGTAAGLKLLDQTPGISREISASVHRRLVEHSPELMQGMMDADFKVFKDALDLPAAEAADTAQ